MLPRVLLHNLVSLDGRVTGFPADPALYYQLAARWKFDAHLTGADTLLSSPVSDHPDEDGDGLPDASPPDGSRALLAVTDSRGRFRQWRQLRSLPYWGRRSPSAQTAPPRSTSTTWSAPASTESSRGGKEWTYVPPSRNWRTALG